MPYTKPLDAEALRRRHTSLVNALADGRRLRDALRELDRRQGDDERSDELADELSRQLIGFCESHHEGWQTLRRLVAESGADVPWTRAERAAIEPTAARILADTGARGRTPLQRVQHAAAEERARTLARYLDPEQALTAFGISSRPADAEQWSAALVRAVTARSREQLATRLSESLADETPASS